MSEEGQGGGERLGHTTEMRQDVYPEGMGLKTHMERVARHAGKVVVRITPRAMEALITRRRR